MDLDWSVSEDPFPKGKSQNIFSHLVNPKAPCFLGYFNYRNPVSPI